MNNFVFLQSKKSNLFLSALHLFHDDGNVLFDWLVPVLKNQLFLVIVKLSSQFPSKSMKFLGNLF